MNTAVQIEPETVTVPRECIVRLPLGLLGFEEIKEYVLLNTPEDEPFLWLEMLEQPRHAFLVISPFSVFPEYKPDISQEDVEFLGLKHPDDAMVLTIATVRGNGSATVNMKGPIVVNRHTFVGKQVIPSNAAQFALQQPLPLAA